MAYECSVSSLIFSPSSSLSALDRSLLNISFSFSGQFRRPCYTVKTEMPESIRKSLTEEQKAMLVERELQRKSAISNSPATDGPTRGSHGTNSDRYGDIGLGRPSTSNSATLKTNSAAETNMNMNAVSKHGDTNVSIKKRMKTYGALGLGRPAPTNTATNSTESSANKTPAMDNKVEANKVDSKKATIGSLGIGLPSTCGKRRPHNRRISNSTMFRAARFARRRLFTIPEEGLEAARFSPRLGSPKVKEFDMRKVHIGTILV